VTTCIKSVTCFSSDGNKKRIYTEVRTELLAYNDLINCELHWVNVAMNTAVFMFLTPCSLLKVTDVSEGPQPHEEGSGVL
jgi:hypothetical protein